jgi:thioredoxin reductase (NADPH)
VVVGNCEETAIDALFLSEIADKILVVTNEPELDISGTLLNRLRDKSNIEIINGKITQIVGEQIVKAIRIVDFGTGREEEKAVKGVFVSLGRVPMTAIVKNAGIDTDENGCLIVDRQQKTNIEGVFTAGDCTCGGMQVVTAG